MNPWFLLKHFGNVPALGLSVRQRLRRENPVVLSAMHHHGPSCRVWRPLLEGPLLACLGISICLAAVLAWSCFARPERTDPASVKAAPSGQRGWYFRSGQWLADARTISAMARWYFEAERAAALGPTNNSWSPLPSTNSAVLRRTA